MNLKYPFGYTMIFHLYGDFLFLWWIFCTVVNLYICDGFQFFCHDFLILWWFFSFEVIFLFCGNFLFVTFSFWLLFNMGWLLNFFSDFIYIYSYFSGMWCFFGFMRIFDHMESFWICEFVFYLWHNILVIWWLFDNIVVFS